MNGTTAIHVARNMPTTHPHVRTKHAHNASTPSTTSTGQRGISSRTVNAAERSPANRMTSHPATIASMNTPQDA
jgi:hypothetical protein